MLFYNKEMSKFKSIHYLRFSNRGNAVQEIVQYSRFSVNLPAALRSLGRSRITVQDALLNFQSQSALDGVMETFITSNIPINQSIDTETYATGNFEGESYQKLVTFSTDQANTKDRERPNAFITFDCDSIPERIEWQIFKRRGDGSTIQPMDRPEAYNFITLKIEVYKEQQ
jgi:hypothetical protein